MAEQITAKAVYVMLQDTFRKRPDLGLRRIVADHLMEPPNPFDPNSVWRPRRWFVFFSFVSLAAIGTVIYFNFWN